MHVVYSIFFIGAGLFPSVFGSLTRREIADVMKRYEDAEHRCIKEMHFGEIMIEEFYNHPNEPERMQQTAKCYFKCVMETFKWMNRNGDITPNTENIYPELIGFGNMCKDATGKDACDKAYNFSRCFMETMTKNLKIE